MKKIFYFLFTVWWQHIFYFCLVQSKDTFSQLSDSLFSNIQCVPYAYGDFNADKRVDIFCVSKSATQVEIWLAQEKEPLFEKFSFFSLKYLRVFKVNFRILILKFFFCFVFKFKSYDCEFSTRRL